MNCFKRLSSHPLWRPRLAAALLLFFINGVGLNVSGKPSVQANRAARFARPPQVGPSAAADAGQMVEEFSFTVKDYRLNHQSEWNILTLVIRYRYVPGITDDAYPDFRLLLKDVEGFLTDYPNEADYWEIVNKKLTFMLLSKYPELSTITCEMHVSPSSKEPYVRSSTVTRNRSELPVVKTRGATRRRR